MIVRRLLTPVYTVKLSLILLIKISLLTTLTGCASVGQEFATSKVIELKIGETTQQEVRQMFGAPWRTGIEDGMPTWTYAKYYYSLFGAEDTQDLVIRFDQFKTVKSYTFNSTPKTSD